MIRSTASLTAAVTIVMLLPGSLTPQRAQAPRGLNADFNGDGFDDLAIGAPGVDVEFSRGSISISIPAAGAVHVLYGGPGGLHLTGERTLAPQTFTQSSLASGDGAEAGDGFGSSLAVGDFNADGFDDLAIGVPGEDTGPANGIKDAGAFHVVYGSTDGLVGATSEFWRQHLPGESTIFAAKAGDRLGWTLAAGNFDGDGGDDLVAGAPWADCPPAICGQPNGVPGSGMMIVWRGTANGLDRSQFDRSYADRGALFGFTMAAGDFNSDGCDDLAVAAPLAGDVRAGVVWVTPGGCMPLIMFGPPTIPPIQPWHQDVGGVADLAEDGDAFGLALSVGDFDADEFEDLAIGVPEEDLAVPPIFTLIRRDAGVLHVLHGGPTGLNVSGSQLWNQNGLGEAPQSFDWFGRALAAGDFNEDGRDDLAIGAPLEGFTGSPNAGLVHTLWGTLNGLTSLFTQQWHQDLPALGHDREPNDAFGMTLFSGDFDGDGAYDLAIGATGEDANAGAVQVLYGPALLGGTQRLSRSILGHVSKPGDRFGGALPGSRY